VTVQERRDILALEPEHSRRVLRDGVD